MRHSATSLQNDAYSKSAILGENVLAMITGEIVEKGRFEGGVLLRVFFSDF